MLVLFFVHITICERERDADG